MVCKVLWDHNLDGFLDAGSNLYNIEARQKEESNPSVSYLSL